MRRIEYKKNKTVEYGRLNQCFWVKPSLWWGASGWPPDADSIHFSSSRWECFTPNFSSCILHFVWPSKRGRSVTVSQKGSVVFFGTSVLKPVRCFGTIHKPLAFPVLVVWVWVLIKLQLWLCGKKFSNFSQKLCFQQIWWWNLPEDRVYHSRLFSRNQSKEERKNWNWHWL